MYMHEETELTHSQMILRLTHCNGFLRVCVCVFSPISSSSSVCVRLVGRSIGLVYHRLDAYCRRKLLKPSE